MATLFRPDPEEDVAEQAGPAVDDQDRPIPEVPEFAVIVSDVSSDGWHMAMVIGETTTPDYYVRAVTVRWPFLIARPARSNRFADKPVDVEWLSPTGTTPARKLVVNWPWITMEGSVSQLRFLVKRAAPSLFGAAGPVRVRLTLKESGGPRRRIVVKMKSNRVNWTPTAPETPASPPEQST
jgi:hypothetical protein